METNQFNKKTNKLIMEQTYTFLTTKELLYRKIIDIFAPFYAKKVSVSAIIVPGYTLLKNLTALSSGTSALIGVFMKNDTKENVFIKKYVFQNKGLRYASLLNELGILQLLQNKNLTHLKKFNLVIPELKRVIQKNNEITIICEYKAGEPLLQKDENIKVETLRKVFAAMRYINSAIQEDINTLPKRNAYVLAITFLYFWVKMSIKKIHTMPKNISLLINFYAQFFLTRGTNNTYGLVHRDLHSRNILLHKNDIIITDWEGTVISDSTYDVAMVARLYMNEISVSNMIHLLKELLPTQSERRRFLYSIIFYTVQTLGLDKKDAKSYQDADAYITILKNQVQPSLLTTN
ncbi:MAG TPA: aminoglycoside phosphotransferase family protein [Candidatus Woesebacteria bacterium]|nr:aminoglycoside phosphotransferase family protein [Candidatus Woesebacteria bacterium]